MDHVFNFWLSVVFISTIGTLAHFTYEWAHHNRTVGLFTAVNESTWEHIKIALTAALLWALYDGFVYGFYPNYFLAKLVSLLIIAITIPAIFYFYRLFAKKSILPIDISLFFIAIILGQLSFFGLVTAPAVPYFAQYLACIGLFIFFGAYMTLTLDPLKIFLFKDPITGKYGFRAHTHLKNLKQKIRTKTKSKPKSRQKSNNSR